MESSYVQKKKIVLNIILYERKKQAMKISSFLKNKLNQNIKKKKFILQQKIKENIELIQKNIRGYLIRKKITDYLSKIRTSYLLKTGIEEKIKNLQMIVFFNNKNRIFDFVYDKFFEKFIFFMERTKVQKKQYKIQFICDGRVIIDPQFPTQEDNGVYINIIDFEQVKKNEEKHRENNIDLIKKCVRELKKKGLSVLPKSYIESYLKNEKKENIINYLYDDENEVTRSSNKLRKKKSDTDILRYHSSSGSNIKHRTFRSFKKLAKIKGILKTPRRSMSKNNSDFDNKRRVSFGWREESF